MDAKVGERGCVLSEHYGSSRCPLAIERQRSLKGSQGSNQITKNTLFFLFTSLSHFSFLSISFFSFRSYLQFSICSLFECLPLTCSFCVTNFLLLFLSEFLICLCVSLFLCVCLFLCISYFLYQFFSLPERIKYSSSSLFERGWKCRRKFHRKKCSSLCLISLLLRSVIIYKETNDISL
jgi:hypothetical protein